MDKNLYHSELEQVRFTPAGRRALTDALLTAASTEVTGRRTSGLRRAAIIALAAVLVIGVTAAATQSLWSGYFADVGEQEQTVIETLRQDIPAVTCNGTTMTPLSAFGDESMFYLLLEIRTSEDTEIPAVDEDSGCYQLFGDGAEYDIRLTDADGQRLSCQPDFDWIDDDPADHVLTAALRLWAADTRFDDGTDKVLHIPGLWIQTPDKDYIPVLTGGWDFPIGNCAVSPSCDLDVDGVTTADANGRWIMELDQMHVSALGIRWRYHWSDPEEDVAPGADLAAVLDDGSTVAIGNAVGSFGDDWNEMKGYFEKPLDLEHVTGMQWGDTFIPLPKR